MSLRPRTVDFRTAKRSLHFAFEQNERLLKVMPVGWRPASWRYMHIDHAIASVRRLAWYGDRVGVADQADMKESVGLG